MTAERFVRVALSALGRVPKLASCTPESVVKCMMTCSELGLEPDGRRAHLIPFGTECTLIVDYKGLVELAMRSGTVSSIFANIVCDTDEFRYLTGEITHEIDFRKPRGPMYAVYCIVAFKDGGKHTEVMTREDVDRIRARSKAGRSGPWVTDYDEMAKKTVFRRASKWITLSPEVQDALDRQDADPTPTGSRLVGEVSAGLLESGPEPVAGEPAPIEIASERAQAAPEPSTPVQQPSAPSDAPQAAPAPAWTCPKCGQNNAGWAKTCGRCDEDAKKAAGSPAAADLHTVQQTLAEVIVNAGFSFSHFQKWCVETGNIPEADSLPAFEDVPTNHCKRLLRAQVGLLKGLQMVKDQEGGVTP
jgi:recombination protein RecT